MSATTDPASAISENIQKSPGNNGTESQGQTAPAEAGAGESKPPDKTISCVSCRRRKLKCDRVKPRCGTCTRLRHECEYPERRRNLGAKRRNMKELEARLAQVETQLVAESKSTSASSHDTPGINLEPNWSSIEMDMNLDLDGGDALDSFDILQSGLGFQTSDTAANFPIGDIFSQELLSLGLQEPLPPQDMIDELHEIYFAKFHKSMPIMHKYRYYASLDRAPHMRPPICLRYALWTIAASSSDKYQAYEGVLYERARRYIESAEMKGHGEAFVSLYHAQTWGLIAHYEAKRTLFSRSWMSTGRMVRMVQMLGLYRLDGDDSGAKTILPPARDWIELEERRRVFWAAYYGDRWASSGTGWPMLIQENDISTNLPASEEAFDNGIMQESISLEEALTPEGGPSISIFGGVILSAALFGRNFQHLQNSGPKSHPEDVANGEFWKRHRQMDNILANTFMFLPEQLRLPANIRDMNIVFIHMNIHSSVICLHRAAVLTGTRYDVDKAVITQSRNRSLMAAEEIANIMRLVCHVDISNVNSWVGFCLYVAGGVFLQDSKSSQPNPASLSSLEFILAAMRAVGKFHGITSHFTTQLELDIEAAGLGNKGNLGKVTTPNLPINGIIPERNGVPMSVENLQDLLPVAGCAISDLPRNSDPTGYNPDFATEPVGGQFWTPLTGVAHQTSSSSSSGNSPGVSTSINHDSPKTGSSSDAHGRVNHFLARSNFHFPVFSKSTEVQPNHNSNKESSHNSSTSTASNTMNFPYRQATPSNANTPASQNIPMSNTMEGFEIPPEWSTSQDFSVVYNPELSGLLANSIWSPKSTLDESNSGGRII